ncbi:DHA2 family efflux MFS transporter permease subunit [Microbacterium sp. NPDC055910]|uniref:DHA2 family efflux MFS transporter permease subunit n=1 Tax=Microbacterium sp. NPDC055910 TaxID=3345659 RepID=UPI0035E0459D
MMTRAATTRSPYLVLLVCGLPFLMMTIDGTVVNVALPTIAKDLGASLQSLQWIVSAYILVIASFVLMAGMLADRFGRRRILAIGVAVFTVGSFLCGLAPDEGLLIASRGFQAIGGAMISPSALAIVTNTFTQPAARAKALGWWSVIASAGIAIGPLLGGLLVQSLGWRAVFWVNIIPGVIAVIALLVWAPVSRAAKTKPFDPVGQILLVLVLGSVVFVIIELSTLGWSSPFIIGGCVIGVVALVSMIVVERRKTEALIPFELFRSRAFTTSILTLVFGVLGLGAVAFTLSLFLQNYRGLSPAEAGLFTLPMAVGSMIAAPLAGRVVAAGRARAVLVFAAVLIIVAGAAFWVTADAAIWLVLIPFLLVGLGFGALNDPVNVSAISELPNEKAGFAASLIAMGRQVGQVLGVAVAGALLAAGLGADMKAHFAEAATSVWILLIVVGVVILVINVLPARTGALPPAHSVPTVRHAPPPAG